MALEPASPTDCCFSLSGIGSTYFLVLATVEPSAVFLSLFFAMLPFPLCNFFSVGEGDRPEDQTEGSPLISPTGNAGRRNTEGVSVAGVHLKPFSVGSFLVFLNYEGIIFFQL